jgi:hypothetical protein
MSALRGKCEVAHTLPGGLCIKRVHVPQKYGRWRKPCSTQYRSSTAISAKPAESPGITKRSHSVSGVTRATFSVGPKSLLGSVIGAAHNIGTKTQRRSLRTCFSSNTKSLRAAAWFATGRINRCRSTRPRRGQSVCPLAQPIPKTYSGSIDGRLVEAQSVARMSRCLRNLVLGRSDAPSRTQALAHRTSIE